jgi:hypothetical protein
MGANFSISCPADFEQGLFLTCHKRCPDDFKYSSEGGVGTTSGNEMCVYRDDNAKTVSLVALPALTQGAAEPSTYADERTRFEQELATVRAAIASDEAIQTEVRLQQAKKGDFAVEYSRIQGEYAGYTSAGGTTEVIKEVSNSLKPFRPPTAPASDLEKERKAISEISNQKLLMVQIALFIVVLVLLTYVVIPGNSAHTVAFLLLSVGVAAAFFLRR